MNVRAIVCLSLGLMMALAVASWADEGPPDPISLDRASPSVVVGYLPGATPGNIYDMLMTGPMPPAPPLGYDAGGPGPIVHVQEMAFGLMPMADNLDGLSNGEMSPHMPLSIYFSGDDMSMGMPNTDYNHQAQRAQAAGDRFVLNGISLASPAAVMAGAVPSISPPMYAGGLGNWPTNLLSANQHRYNEIPSIGPAAFNAYVPPVAGATVMDDMDALELTPLDTNGDKVHDTPIYLSLDAASPTLGMIGASPADILVAPPMMPVMGVFAPSFSMGLTPLDEVDALAVWNVAGGMQVAPGLDYALFSLAPGSPYLQQNGRSAADIFVTNFTGMNLLYLPCGMLGMQFEDNIDALDVEYAVGGIIQEPLDWVSNMPHPNLGDYNGDGATDAADYTVWRDNLGNGFPGGPPIPGDGDDGTMTGTQDGWVSEFDYIYWKANFHLHGSGSMLAGAVPEPASVVLAVMAMVMFGLTAARRVRS
jgi:hypothetical protein